MLGMYFGFLKVHSLCIAYVTYAHNSQKFGSFIPLDARRVIDVFFIHHAVPGNPECCYLCLVYVSHGHLYVNYIYPYLYFLYHCCCNGCIMQSLLSLYIYLLLEAIVRQSSQSNFVAYCTYFWPPRCIYLSVPEHFRLPRGSSVIASE